MGLVVRDWITDFKDSFNDCIYFNNSPQWEWFVVWFFFIYIYTHTSIYIYICTMPGTVSLRLLAGLPTYCSDLCSTIIVSGVFF